MRDVFLWSRAAGQGWGLHSKKLTCFYGHHFGEWSLSLSTSVSFMIILIVLLFECMAIKWLSYK